MLTVPDTAPHVMPAAPGRGRAQGTGHRADRARRGRPCAPAGNPGERARDLDDDAPEPCTPEIDPLWRLVFRDALGGRVDLVACLHHRRNYIGSLRFLGLPAPSHDQRLPDTDRRKCRHCPGLRAGVPR